MTDIEAIKILQKANIELSRREGKTLLTMALIKAIPALREKTERERPKPLTLEELKQMDGEPIWCEWVSVEDRALERGSWFIVIKDDGEKTGFSVRKPLDFGCSICRNDYYGKTWLAYKHKPNHDGEATEKVLHEDCPVCGITWKERTAFDCERYSK